MMDVANPMLAIGRTWAWQDAQHDKTVVARLDRAIQYAAASALTMTVSGILGRPVIGERSDAVLRTAMPGDDSGVCSFFIRVDLKADTEVA